eukprot:15003746-Heterocapsa_arctica.AAC.1
MGGMAPAVAADPAHGAGVLPGDCPAAAPNTAAIALIQWPALGGDRRRNDQSAGRPAAARWS